MYSDSSNREESNECDELYLLEGVLKLLLLTSSSCLTDLHSLMSTNLKNCLLKSVSDSLLSLWVQNYKYGYYCYDRSGWVRNNLSSL